MGFKDSEYLTNQKLYDIFANSKEGKDLDEKHHSLFLIMQYTYLSNSDYEALFKPSFFDGKISREAIDGLSKDNNNSLTIRDIHMKMLTEAYIRYHSEKVVKSIDDEDSKTFGLKHPEFVTEMPKSIRDYAFSKGKSFVKECIDDVIFNNDSYDALAILSDRFVDKTLNKLGEKENPQVKLFLKAARDEIADEAKNTLKDADLTIVINNIDWSNEQERKKLFSMVREFADSTEAISYAEILNGAKCTVVINNPKDIERIEELQNSFKGANVTLSYAVSPEIKGDEFIEITEKINKNLGISQNPEVQARIDVINQTENISDIAGLIVDMALDGAFNIKDDELKTFINQAIGEKVGMEVNIVSDKSFEELSSAVHIDIKENLTFDEKTGEEIE